MINSEEIKRSRAKQIGASVARGTLRFTWGAIRFFLLSVLITLVPIVNIVLAGVAFLGACVAIFYKIIGAPHFPFLPMLLFSVGCTMLLILYHAAIHVLSGAD